MDEQDETRGENDSALQDRWRDILERLQKHARYLMDQGSLSSRVASGRRVWSVRFYVRDQGKVTQKSIYIGSNPVLVGWAQQFVDYCREQGDVYRPLKTIERMSAVIWRGVDRFYRR